nr:hypothetical protein RchiOBHm_Chr7g0208131 [Ipomoea batatas]
MMNFHQGSCVIWRKLLVEMSECVIALLLFWISLINEQPLVKLLYRFHSHKWSTNYHG